MTEKCAIFASYHKPFPIPNSEIIFPVFTENLVLDEKCNSNRAIHLYKKSTKGNENGKYNKLKKKGYCECTTLRWLFENASLDNYLYIGFCQYRRFFIFNSLYEKRSSNKLDKEVYKCIHLKASNSVANEIGLNSESISDILDEYDCIVPYSCDLKKMGVTSVYDDWVSKIPGVHLNDLTLLEKMFCESHLDMADDFVEYLNSSHKLMYHMFIMKKELFYDYCEWLFEMLDTISPYINVEMYSENGKRTLAYLAEVLYGFYFTYMEKNGKYQIKHLGVAMLDD